MLPMFQACLLKGLVPALSIPADKRGFEKVGQIDSLLFTVFTRSRTECGFIFKVGIVKVANPFQTDRIEVAADRLLPVQLLSEVGALKSAGCCTIFIFLDNNTLASIDTGNFVPGTIAAKYHPPLFDPSVGIFTQTIFHNFPGLV